MPNVTLERIEAVAKELARHETRYLFALDVAKMAILEWDVATLRPKFDDRALKLFGIERAELDLPGGFFNRVHPDDVGRLKTALQDSAKNGGPYDCIIRFKRYDKWQLMHIKGATMNDETGKPEGILGICCLETCSIALSRLCGECPLPIKCSVA